MTFSNVKTGLDPEFFIQRYSIDDQSAYQLLELHEACKFFPPIKGAKLGGNNHVVGYDGVAAEINICPAACHEIIMTRVARALDTIASKGLFPSMTSWIELTDMAEMDERSIELGCSVSKNVHGLRGILTPEIRLRTTGWHVHFQTKAYNDNNKYLTPTPKVMDSMYRFLCDGIRCLDVFLLPLQVALLGKWAHPDRRRHYGQPGEHRWHPDQQLIEYRALDGAVGFSQASAHLFTNLARAFVYKYRPTYTDEMLDHAIKIAMNNKIIDARAYVNKHVDVYMDVLTNTYLGVGKDEIRTFLTNFIPPVSGNVLSGWETIGSSGLFSSFSSWLWTMFNNQKIFLQTRVAV